MNAEKPQNVAENKHIIAREMGAAEGHFVTVDQYHSNVCLYTNSTFKEPPPRADALVTDRPGLLLGVLTADCGPVLFCGRKENGDAVTGAVHAGWRGALDAVLEATLAQMKARGALPKSIAAVIGPCIGPDSYEVDDGFVREFVQKEAGYKTFFAKGRDANHFLFDLPGFIEARLSGAGVSRIFRQWRDTFADEEHYFSFRRESLCGDETCGRQASVIVIAE